jgi:hypothetical protein
VVRRSYLLLYCPTRIKSTKMMTTKILTNQFPNQLLEGFPLLFQLLNLLPAQMTHSEPILLEVIHSEKVLILLLLILIHSVAGKMNHFPFYYEFCNVFLCCLFIQFFWRSIWFFRPFRRKALSRWFQAVE